MNDKQHQDRARPIPAAVKGRAGPRARHRRSLDDADAQELEITPMIDTTFLLLIFFMVSTAISAAARLQLPKSTSGLAEETEDRVVLVLDFPEGLEPANSEPLTGSRFIMLADAKLYLFGNPERNIDPTQLEATLRNEFAAKSDAKFILQASRKMPVGVVREVLKAAKLAGATDTMVAVSMDR